MAVAEGFEPEGEARVADSSAPTFPLAGFLEMATEATQQGMACARVEVQPKHLNPHGTLHGAVLFAMVDTAMGAATMSVLGAGQLCASIDVQLRFCKPVFTGSLLATATVVQQGKRVIHLRADVHNSMGELVAFATGSFAVIGPP